MKNAPAFGIKPAANPATTGTKAPKHVPSNARIIINIPVREAMKPEVPARPAADYIKAASVQAVMPGARENALLQTVNTREQLTSPKNMMNVTAPAFSLHPLFTIE